jgi:D-alanyl-D-alanine carboxypeptidase
MSKRNNSSGGAVVLDVILTLALLAGSAYGCFFIASKGVKIDQTTTYYVPEPTEATTEPDPDALVFENTEVPNTEMHNGSLILVNNATPCVTSESGLVSLYDKKLEADSHSFSVRDADLKVQEPFADAIIAMLDAFYTATDDDNLLVSSGYRSQDAQKELYDKAVASDSEDVESRVAKPGFSESQTGFCMDLSIYGGGDYDGSGVYEWIDQNCAAYGIILRYPSGKEDATMFQYQPWHYRYVGKPHAAFMMQNDLVLEEYISLLESSYTYEGEHLPITDTDGKVYEVYYFKADEGYDSTMVPVPAGHNYTISGTNTGGFIVTVDTGKTDIASAVPVEEDFEGEASEDGETAENGIAE